jgi:hypothetical protein
MWGSASFSLIVRSCDRAAPPHDSSQTARTWQAHGKVKADVLYLGNLDSCVTCGYVFTLEGSGIVGQGYVEFNERTKEVQCSVFSLPNALLE